MSLSVDRCSLLSYHAATGGDDHSVKMWDLRKRKCIYTIPAHANLISYLRFERKLLTIATVIQSNTFFSFSYFNFLPIFVILKKCLFFCFQKQVEIFLLLVHTIAQPRYE